MRAVAIAAVLACACSAQTDDADPAAVYPDVVALFDQGVARTCALNNGVCHNSNNYPDLHTISNLVSTVGRPCNMATTEAAEVNDACEPAADHLVIPSAGIDARIASATLLPAEMDVDVTELTQITLVLDPAPAGLAPGATDTQIHRGTIVFDIGAHGARVDSVDGATVVLDLTARAYGDWSTKVFFDIRTYPPGPLHLVVGDPNGNGIQGALGAAMPLVTAGDPMRSYVMRRLTDATYGELMPRQCRTWDDRANQALACWIAGLQVDGGGAVTNAYAPIDYAACGVDVRGLGKCAQIEATGFAAVEAIFARSCAGNGCHVNEDEPASGLDLTPGRAYGSLVDIGSVEVPDKQRIAAGSPDDSYLLCKVSADCGFRRGARMPLDADALSDADIDVIRMWVADGAPP